MTTNLDSPARSRRLTLDGGTIAALAGAAVAFNLGGALHPNDNGTGNKVAQLHHMLLQSSWYPAHLGLLAAFALFTVAFLRLRGRPELAPITRRIVRVMVVVSALTTSAMVPHLLAPLGADSIADGRSSALSVFMTVDETLADAPWALGIALLALVAGVTGNLGNRLTAVLGTVGGASFAAAAVTIPFTDALDGLFAVGGMGITLWALSVVAVAAYRRRHPDLARVQPADRTTGPTQ
ncbi:hypothetical protein [Kribbella monticola]|uniref:hypothetical protein n=1 Tax=Kribbella monticola TaxID=2185285 RepID=UPI000DD2D5B5|nr:hypothetical protein [Kribbella monticola]